MILAGFRILYLTPLASLIEQSAICTATRASILDETFSLFFVFFFFNDLRDDFIDNTFSCVLISITFLDFYTGYNFSCGFET